jgi:hypothetical protein
MVLGQEVLPDNAISSVNYFPTGELRERKEDAPAIMTVTPRCTVAAVKATARVLSQSAVEEWTES